MKNRVSVSIIAILVCLLAVILAACSERNNSLTHTVEYETNGGTVLPSYTGETVFSMPIPKKEGFTFEGWYENFDFSGKIVSFPYPLSQNTVLYAKYIDNNIGNLELVYETAENGFIVTAYNGASHCIYIPEKHNGQPVIKLKEGFIKDLYNPIVLYISSSVIEIAESFYNCKRLETISVGGMNTAFCSSDGVLYNKDTTTLICCPPAYAKTELTVEDNTETISKYAFRNCRNISVVNIGKSLNSAEKAFYACVGLTEIRVNVANVSFSTVGGVLFDKNINVLYAYPSYNTAESYALPSGVKEVADGAFFGCNLKELTFNSELTDIGDFVGLDKLNRIIVSDNSTTYKAVDGVLFDKGGSNLLKYPSAKSETEYTIPNGVKKVKSYAFCDVSYLASIIFSTTTETLESYSFYGKMALTKMNFSSGSNLKIIESGALIDCKNLIELVLTARTPPKMEYGELSKCPDRLKISVPENLRSLYEISWEEYADKFINGEKTEEFTIVFNSQSGSFVGSVTAAFIETEPVPILEGYTFLGWYDNREGTGTKILFPYVITEDKTLFAAWN